MRTKLAKTMLSSAAIGAVLVPFALGILKAQAATSISGSQPATASSPMATLGEFEVTSIRVVQGSLFGRLACQATNGIMETYVPSAALAKRLLRPTPVPQGRCVGQTDLGHLIELAYRLPAEAVPEWAATQRFEIEAVAPNIANVTTSAFAEMLQRMLADRFKLAFHREMRDTRGYALVLARNGPRIKQASGPSEPPQLSITAGAQREATIKGKSSMTDLAEFLATLVSEGRVLSPVADETTLTGLYDYTIIFSMPQAGPRGGATGDMLQAVAQALQDQLGLRIEARVTQAERIVVDRVDRPSNN